VDEHRAHPDGFGCTKRAQHRVSEEVGCESLALPLPIDRKPPEKYDDAGFGILRRTLPVATVWSTDPAARQ
jgi:hypothetical protein